jgi:phytoene dehydrogenase-like protein
MDYSYEPRIEMGNKGGHEETQHHIPDLNDHIAVKVVGSPTTSEDFCGAPFGNAYGSAMLAKDTTSRLSARMPFSNLYWCNASSGIPSIYGTVSTGSNLYMDLTGDEFYDSRTAPTDEEFIASLPISLPQ